MRAALLLCAVLVSCGPQPPTQRFDEAAWKAADLTGRARAEMLGDFLERYPLKGRTRGEVVSLLGEPTPTDKWEGAEMVYVLGNDGSSMPIDHEWLLIELDHQQRVASFRRVVD